MSDVHRSQIDALLAEAGIVENSGLIRRIVETGIGLGSDQTDRLDLKITASALQEMRAAFALFAPFYAAPKVTVFGSARTKRGDALYDHAEHAARALADEGWMVVTGAGPGIMQAAAEGAGIERSLGVSIRLPFEPNSPHFGEGMLVSMKYFFTRKLMLMKESRGFICLPGGFGTLDETFELLTLQQTGKAEPMPIVLLDQPGGTYWTGLSDFVVNEVEASGMVTPGDLDRALITDSVDAAVAHITDFWRNYDSLRWVDDRLVLRMRVAPSDNELQILNDQFAHLLASGRIERTEPLPAEIADNDRLDLARLTLDLDPHRVGALYTLIRALNAFSPTV